MYRALVADGEFVTRQALRAIIDATEGFEAVHVVGNGEKAVDLCCSGAVDIAFLATVMPGLPGMEVAKRIHERVPALPLVLVATTDSAAFAKEALQYNGNGYVIKPISVTAVRNILLAHKAAYAFDSPALAETLRAAIASRDFVRAYAGIPAFAAEALNRAGKKSAARRELLARVAQRLAPARAHLPGGGEPADVLPVFDEQLLAVDNGVALNLFAILDAAFRRNCVVAYPVIAAAFSFIEAHIGDKIGLEDIVHNAAASQTHVSRIFKKFYRCSVMDYLHLRKLHAAKMMFAYSGRNAAETAFALGYSEAGYFSKVFKKFEHMTVQQYRASLRQ